MNIRKLSNELMARPTAEIISIHINNLYHYSSSVGLLPYQEDELLESILNNVKKSYPEIDVDRVIRELFTMAS